MQVGGVRFAHGKNGCAPIGGSESVVDYFMIHLLRLTSKLARMNRIPDHPFVLSQSIFLADVRQSKVWYNRMQNHV